LEIPYVVSPHTSPPSAVQASVVVAVVVDAVVVVEAVVVEESAAADEAVVVDDDAVVDVEAVVESVDDEAVVDEEVQTLLVHVSPLAQPPVKSLQDWPSVPPVAYMQYQSVVPSQVVPPLGR